LIWKLVATFGKWQWQAPNNIAELQAGIEMWKFSPTARYLPHNIVT
jgi:hypothetical protein